MGNSNYLTPLLSRDGFSLKISMGERQKTGKIAVLFDPNVLGAPSSKTLLIFPVEIASEETKETLQGVFPFNHEESTSPDDLPQTQRGEETKRVVFSGKGESLSIALKGFGVLGEEFGTKKAKEEASLIGKLVKELIKRETQCENEKEEGRGAQRERENDEGKSHEGELDDEPNTRVENDKIMSPKFTKKNQKEEVSEEIRGIREVVMEGKNDFWEIKRILKESETMKRVSERIKKRRNDGGGSPQWAENSKGKEVAGKIQESFENIDKNLNDLLQVLDQNRVSFTRFQENKAIRELNEASIAQNKIGNHREFFFSENENDDLAESLVVDLPVEELLGKIKKDSEKSKEPVPNCFQGARGHQPTELAPLKEDSDCSEECPIDPDDDSPLRIEPIPEFLNRKEMEESSERLSDSLALSESQSSKAFGSRLNFQSKNERKLDPSSSGVNSAGNSSFQNSNVSNAKSLNENNRFKNPELVTSEILEEDSIYESSPTKLISQERNFSSCSGKRNLNIEIDEDDDESQEKFEDLQPKEFPLEEALFDDQAKVLLLEKQKRSAIEEESEEGSSSSAVVGDFLDNLAEGALKEAI